ncbi:DUF5134 domain-containing protein [Yinghuangia soli]|uniref:DUF5134 domain-containing protein n=1 Tax=Yinghuangia soli TaxID=2908204 RepID=A0AA41Q122_9ACTN|nr:DUF5134 domain-containing protein [Yinghuangia soli]MCF2529594.1 DUF5134 domain-containing protein [Yinghuangia soli]
MDAQLIAAQLGVAAGLAGAYVHRQGPPRGWLPHVFMAAAMAAMALPEHDPLGPAGWMLVLGCAAAWSLGRPGVRPGRVRAAAALDLYAMGVLTLLMPAVHGGGHGSGHASGQGAAAASDWWSAPYAVLLIVWAAARLALAAAEHRNRNLVLASQPSSAAATEGAARPSVSSACSAAMIASMAMMAFAV